MTRGRPTTGCIATRPDSALTDTFPTSFPTQRSTLLNSAGSRICEACTNPRASGGDGADASPPEVAEEAPPENMWCCAVCTYHNAMFSSRCVICTQVSQSLGLCGQTPR